MTKVVKEYVERKIREGAERKIDELADKKSKALESSITKLDFERMIFSSKEYKAFESFILKLAKANGAELRRYSSGQANLVCTQFYFSTKATAKAEKELNDFKDKVSNVVQEALVTMELSKSKDDIDKLIAEALANLV